jgi:menaquinone-dependent protoporphyrinogen IX oxidase
MEARVPVAYASKMGGTAEIAEAVGLMARQKMAADFRDWEQIRLWAADVAAQMGSTARRGTAHR